MLFENTVAACRGSHIYVYIRLLGNLACNTDSRPLQPARPADYIDTDDEPIVDDDVWCLKVSRLIFSSDDESMRDNRLFSSALLPVSNATITA